MIHTSAELSFTALTFRSRVIYCSPDYCLQACLSVTEAYNECVGAKYNNDGHYNVSVEMGIREMGGKHLASFWLCFSVRQWSSP